MTNVISDVLEFPCIEVTQPIGTFYIGSLDNKIIQRICWADVRRIEGEFREVEVISGLQRKISEPRVKKIEAYVETVDATFPTSIILAIPEAYAEFDAERNIMLVKDGDDVAKVIDGQHRIKGLRKFQGKFQLNVAIFIEMEPQDQAIVFSTINLTQTKVSKSLVYDLLELVEARSPQKTCHNIARVAHYSHESPFLGRIKILGTARDKETELLTQAGFVEPLLRLISLDPLKDGDLLKRESAPKKISDQEAASRLLVFRNLFIEGRDEVIARTLFNYFLVIAKKWPLAWDTKAVGYILNRTTGYRSFMNVLPYICIAKGIGEEIPKEYFLHVLNRCTLISEDFTTENFPPGATGEGRLTNRLLNNLGFGGKLGKL